MGQSLIKLPPTIRGITVGCGVYEVIWARLWQITAYKQLINN
jgi:hypothetical protein